MTTLNISLPDSMRSFIDEQVAKGGYSTASEYIRDLIRQAQKKADQEKLEAMLLEGLESGEPIEVTDEWWEQKRAQMMQRFRQQKK
ncbi:MAG: type II toxin-antitoxin system ParD family antitoxin [Scytonema hyalinum WJT4-NPBG1]|jgi:antitoxin ParD1/3/4|nr:type II toxin-antitoxin system ParD family antitoxin [Scytonema hyalinum WJT4-NPBG1]